MKICMAGACGRMGRRILDLAAAMDDVEPAGAFDLPQWAGTELTLGAESGRPRKIVVGADRDAEIAKADVLIDFTHADAAPENAGTAAALGKPAVVGTTNLTGAQAGELRRLARQIPVVYAPNMSVGVNLLFKLTGEVARVLGLDYNVEVVEVHHNKKKDSPSGTAKRLAECAAEALGLRYEEHTRHGRAGEVGERPVREIGMHAVRGGDVVGEHTVSFIGQGERIELVHKAHSRDNFARGAILAARFAIKAAPGLYDMQDVLGLK